jgi:hypothetical protein
VDSRDGRSTKITGLKRSVQLDDWDITAWYSKMTLLNRDFRPILEDVPALRSDIAGMQGLSEKVSVLKVQIVPGLPETTGQKLSK